MIVELYYDIVASRLFILRYIKVHLTKRIVMSMFVFQASSHFHNVFTDALHLPQIPL